MFRLGLQKQFHSRDSPFLKGKEGGWTRVAGLRMPVPSKEGVGMPQVVVLHGERGMDFPSAVACSAPGIGGTKVHFCSRVSPLSQGCPIPATHSPARRRPPAAVSHW